MVDAYKHTEYKEEKSDYLPLGQYKFVYNDTWFLTFETKSASSSFADDLPPVVMVDPAEIIPDNWPELRTMLISFHVSKQEISSEKGVQVSLCSKQLLTQELPELNYTKSYLKEVVLQEESFTIFSNQKLLSQPLCRFASQIWRSSTERNMLSTKGYLDALVLVVLLRKLRKKWNRALTHSQGH